MVAVLKLLKMTKKFSEVTLQNAVVNASFAAAVESELPPADVIVALGGGEQGYEAAYTNYLNMLGEYVGESSNIAIDGAKIPHLFPGTKLSLKPIGTPGGVGTEFEASLLRKIAAALGVSYEELARDYSKVSYSSARASMQTTWRFMQSRKKIVADKLASMVYTLWLEEEIAQGNVPLPPGWTRDNYYLPLMSEAISQCTWIGSGRGQIDELKETQAAILRIKSGLSTYEEECARLGNDFRRVFAQRRREERIIQKYGLAFSLDAQKSTDGNGTQGTLQDNNAGDPNHPDNEGAPAGD
jgi:lambda family phage portal protein